MAMGLVYKPTNDYFMCPKYRFKMPKESRKLEENIDKLYTVMK
jgi:hypothetical protein